MEVWTAKQRRSIIRTFIRANHKIRVSEVRCIKDDGAMIGVIPTKEAMLLAEEAGLDLVEISPNAEPPVCRIMDFGKYRYEESVRQKKARKQSHTKNKAVKEIKFHANVAEHDYWTKVNHAKKFLENGHKVKISLQFRGRENAHRELGFELVKRVLKDCEDVCTVDFAPKMVGRSVMAMLSPKGDNS